jgi:D-alanine-D-alanine ligase
LSQAFEEAFQFDRKIIIEEGVVAREIEIGVMGNDKPECSVAGEIVPKKDFYDYKAKYEDGETALIIPAEISDEVYAEMKDMAVKSYKALDNSGLVRADFFLTKDGRVLINEVNTMPGFTSISMYPKMMAASGVSYPDLLSRLVTLALHRHEQKHELKRDFQPK